MMKVAVLDDYQGVALTSADWSSLKDRAEITVFRDHLPVGPALVERLKPFEAVVAMRERTPFKEELLSQLDNLKLILSTGRRNAAIDLKYAAERGITVCHTGYSSHGAMEHSWALILSALRHIPQENTSFKSAGWQTRIGIDLKGKTIGIVGLGNIGGAIARIARAFEMEVIAWSQNLTDEKAQAAGARRVEKEELFRQADIVTLHLILSGRTRDIVGKRELGLMKPSAWLINTSRGPLIDETALIEALQEKRIAGAALDVFDTEPLPADHPFRTMDNLLATPHIGYVTEDTYKIFYQDTVENLVAWLDGKPIRILELHK
jgi:phosphoglycerate dehydrogenase-like enzyme